MGRPPQTHQPQPTVLATALPLELGASGCLAKGRDGSTYTLTAAVPGDSLRVAPLRTQGDPQPAAVIQVERPSPARVQAPCRLLDQCGACTFQSMAYAAQLEAKDKALRRLLEPLYPAQIDAPQGLRQPFGYRTRLLLQAEPTTSRGHGLRLGFYRRGAARLVPIQDCPVQHPLTLELVKPIVELLQKDKIHATTTQHSQSGWLHGLGIRADVSTGQREVVLVVRSERAPVKPHFLRRIAALPGVASLHLAVTPKRTSHLYGDKFVHAGGHKRTIFHLAGQDFHLSPGSFFQTSQEGAELLLETLRSMMPQEVETLADLYGGVGVVTRATEGLWKKALVAESNPQAIDDLQSWRRVARRHDIKVFPGLVENTLHKVLAQKPDTVVLDPPRGGCHPRVIEALTRQPVPHLIYVACGAQALERDAAALTQAGYHIERVASVDMFPHTPHLEVVAKMSYRGSV